MSSIDQREDTVHDSDHHSSSPDTPLRADAFVLSDEEKEADPGAFYRHYGYIGSGPFRRQSSRHAKAGGRDDGR